MKDTEFKPCPFCKNVGFDGEKLNCVIIEPYINSYGKIDGVEISCDNIYCPFQPSGWFETEEEAICAWNRNEEREERCIY